MLANKSLFRKWIGVSILVFTSGFLTAHAQDTTVAEIKYKEDYDRIQRIVKVSQPIKRADQLVALFRERPDLDDKLRNYAENFFARDLESLAKQGNYVAVRGLSERVLKLRPRFGEVYLFYGIALKNEKKISEAMNAFAKCYVITNPLQKKAKQQLDIAYRATSGGSLIGQEKIIRNAIKELK